MERDRGMANIRKAKVGLEDRLWRGRGRRQGRGRSGGWNDRKGVGKSGWFEPINGD